jgi:hypothetical protein
MTVNQNILVDKQDGIVTRALNHALAYNGRCRC